MSPVTIPALTTIVDRQFKEDRTLCPVQALRYYLDRTKDLRRSPSLLFISFKKGQTSDSRPATLSSWLKQTILLFYKQAEQQALDLVQVKVHDIRAFAASKAFYGGGIGGPNHASLSLESSQHIYYFLPKRPYLVRQRQQYVSVSSSGGTTPRPFSSDQLSSERKGGGHICYNQVFRSLIPGSRYRLTSQDVMGKVFFIISIYSVLCIKDVSRFSLISC